LNPKTSTKTKNQKLSVYRYFVTSDTQQKQQQEQQSPHQLQHKM